MLRIALGSDEEAAVVGLLEAHATAAGHHVVRLAGGEEWPEVGRRVAEAVVAGEVDLGVVCCHTGTGVSMAANKVAGARCALCVDASTASGARRWNDANVLALSLRLLSGDMAREILDAFLAAGPDTGTAETVRRLERPGKATS